MLTQKQIQENRKAQSKYDALYNAILRLAVQANIPIQKTHQGLLQDLNSLMLISNDKAYISVDLFEKEDQLIASDLNRVGRILQDYGNYDELKQKVKGNYLVLEGHRLVEDEKLKSEYEVIMHD